MMRPGCRRPSRLVFVFSLAPMLGEIDPVYVSICGACSEKTTTETCRASPILRPNTSLLCGNRALGPCFQTILLQPKLWRCLLEAHLTSLTGWILLGHAPAVRTTSWGSGTAADVAAAGAATAYPVRKVSSQLRCMGAGLGPAAWRLPCAQRRLWPDRPAQKKAGVASLATIPADRTASPPPAKPRKVQHFVHLCFGLALSLSVASPTQHRNAQASTSRSGPSWIALALSLGFMEPQRIRGCGHLFHAFVDQFVDEACTRKRP